VASDTDSRGRKRKGKAKAVEETPIGGKRKRGMKSMSVTPSIAGDEEDEERDQVCIDVLYLYLLN